jgi:hypothetical protein
MTRISMEKTMNETECKSDEVQRALADVEQAGVDVRRAVGALEVAEEKLDRAEHTLEEAEKHKLFKVTVLYNGLEREVEAKPDELVKKLLVDAIAAFQSVTNPHTLSLFTKDGRELDDNQTVREAKVIPCETLLLRPGAVKGGA